MKKILLFAITFLVVPIMFAGCDWYFQSSKMVSIKSQQDIGSVEEQIIGIDYWDGKIILTPYLWNHKKRLKIYGINTGEENIYLYHSSNHTYESAYRVWTSEDGNILNFTTEHPPQHWARSKATGWGLQKHFADRDWSLLGRRMENGVQTRGLSGPKIDGSIEILTGMGWENLPTVRGNDNSSRIYWTMESFNDEYYLGTSWAENNGYKAHFCGNLYKLDDGKWNVLYGQDAGISCGGIYCISTADDKLFVGTYLPAEILIMDNEGDFDKQMIDTNGYVEQMWKDYEGRVFAGVYGSTYTSVYQWNKKEEEFEQIWRRDVLPSDDIRWGAGGVCVDDEYMYVKFRDGNVSRVVKLAYEED